LFPLNETGMINFGPVNIYVYEITLILAFLLALTMFSLRILSIGKKKIMALQIFIPLFILALIGLSQGILNSNASFSTIFRDLRPIIYWGSGLVLIFVGHQNMPLKSMFWLIAVGLVLQFLVCIGLVFNNPSLLIESGFRFPGHSGYLTIIVIALILISMTYKNKIEVENVINLKLLKIICAVLILNIILVQNRTTWIAIVLMIGWWSLNNFRADVLIKMSYSFFAYTIFFIILLVSGVLPQEQIFLLKERVVKDIFSEEGVRATWEGTREEIYLSSYRDFMRSPVLGRGFGHQFEFEFIDKIDKFKSQSGVDNSWLNVLVKCGAIGTLVFTYFIYKLFSILKKSLTVANAEDSFYLRAFYLSFPFLFLMSFNLSIFYNYAEVVILSMIYS
jgi:hypothetical protein